MKVRFPLIASSLQGVGFVDVGQIWADRSDFDLGDLEVTPGVGIRYLSPIGPIRLDLGLRSSAEQVLPVATRGLRAYLEGTDDPASRLTVPWAGGDSRTLDWIGTDEVAFLPSGATFGGSGSLFSFSRLQLHISIGQAF